MFLQEYGEKWVDIDGIRTRYFEAGSGRRVVLVHGGTKGDSSGGANAEDFHLNFAELANKFHVISVDRLGQGYTDNPKRDEDWTMGASVRHFAGFLKALDKGPYNVVGHSRGGYVVARVTLDYPRLIESCVLIDSNTASPRPGRNEIVFATNPHKAGTLEASRWTYEKYSCTTQHVTNAWIEMKQKITELPKNKIAIAKMKDEGFLHTRFLPALVEEKDEFFSKLETVGMQRPTMLFWGYNDPTAPLDLGMELYDLIAKKQPRTSLHIVNQAGHHSFRERAAEFNRVVTEFIEGVAHGATDVKEKPAAAVRNYYPANAEMGEEKWLDLNGIRTRYFDQGEGAPIVMIHGAQFGASDGASSAGTWALNFPVLKAWHNAIAFDKLGQGYTDNPKSDADYTMHAIVQHAIAFLDKLGKKPYHLVGHSRGGYVVSRLALERPDLVKTCVCVSSGSLSPGQSRTHLVFKDPPQPQLSRESIRWYCERYSYNPKIVTEDWLGGSVAIAETERNKIAVAKMNNDGLSRRQFLPQMAKQRSETHRWLLQRGMPCPTLVVWGYNDPAASLDNGMQLIELFMEKQRDTEVRIFNRSGHFVMREHPAAFNRLIDTYVSARR